LFQGLSILNLTTTCPDFREMRTDKHRFYLCAFFICHPEIKLRYRHCEANFLLDEAILKRLLVAIVVRLLRRLKKPSRNDDRSIIICH
jgi:hypothetical protein